MQPPPELSIRPRAHTNLFKTIMNRFLNKKKASGHATIAEEPHQNQPPSPPHAKSKRWGKNKKPLVAQRPQLDLSAVLPSTDDFRTSLIMPNLSARFSMLREQDDPRSKIGKASDDSVLLPTRQSRLFDFGFQPKGLSDIAEVASIHSPVRPVKRYELNATDDNETLRNGSVMGRARPGEAGNTLFGGRQKVFKIAADSLTGLPRSNTSSSLGRVVYEDDVSQSAFQKHKQLERDEAAMAAEQEILDAKDDFDLPKQSCETISTPDEVRRDSDDQSKWPLHSTPLSSHDRRPSDGSCATTASTTATSVASQITAATAPPAIDSATSSAGPAPPLERSLTKRRLYEQGLDQHIYDQQATALTRLNSIQKQRMLKGAKVPPPLRHAQSSGNLHDRAYQPYAVRPLSPTAAPVLTTFGSLRMLHSDDSGLYSGPTSPMSPPLNEYDEFGVLSSALEPGDRGKATAMGAFNKPKHQFDEQQYLARQMQLQHSIDAPLSGPDRAMDRTQSTHFDTARQTPPLRPSPAESRPTNTFANAFAVFQAAAHTAGAHSQTSQPAVAPPRPRKMAAENISNDKVESAGSVNEKPRHVDSQQPSSVRRETDELALAPTHPALRNHGFDFTEVAGKHEDGDDIVPNRADPSMASAALLHPYAAGQEKQAINPSAGIGIATAALSGLIHQHLRNTSNQSSLYPSGIPADADGYRHSRMPSNQSSIYTSTLAQGSSVPSLTDDASRTTHQTYGSENRNDSTYTHCNPWDHDDRYGDNHGGENETARPAKSSQSSQTALTSAPSKANVGPRAAAICIEESDGLKAHNRDASTATQQEREAFAAELALRQRAIQENLRTMVVVETDNHVGNLQPDATGAMKTFGMLKPKPSREFVVNKQGMKMLGLSSAAANISQTSLYSQDNRDEDRVSRQQHHGKELRSASNPQRSRSPYEHKARAELYDQRPREARPNQNPERHGPRPPFAQTRTRSPAAAPNGRSVSRSGQPRDVVERVAKPGTVSSSNANPKYSPMPPQQVSSRPSPDTSQRQLPFPESHGRTPANHRAAHPHDTRPNGLQTTTSRHLAPNGPTPTNLPSASYSPGQGVSPRPSPTPTPYTTAPLSSASSTATTSTQMAPTPYVPLGKPTNQLLRKKTVHKTDISEPTLVSSTSNVDTVDLPPGASLKNGMDDTDASPAVPALHPRRRRTQKLLGMMRNASYESDKPDVADSPPLPAAAGPGPAFSRVRSPEPLVQNGDVQEQLMAPRSVSDGARPSAPRAVRSQESFRSMTPPFPHLGSESRPVMTEGGMF